MLAAAVLSLLSAPRIETLNLTVGGTERRALVVAPADQSGPAPVVFAFHGHGGGMVYAARRYRIPAAWPQAIVVYPQGLPTMTSLDPKGSNNGWEVRASESNKDVQFFDEMLKSIENKYKVNKSKIFVMGHSNGGFFSYTLWALRANEIAGFGVFEGSKFLGVNLTVPKPLFVTIGDQDPLVPPKKQRDSMQAAIDLDGGSSGTPAGANETLFKGKQPVMLWAYHGGHDFQRDAVQPMVDFWKKL